MLHPPRAVATITVIISSAAALSAQLSFEVAALRPSTSLREGGSMGPKPGRFVAGNVPATAFVTFGHNLKSYQVIGAPDWARTDRYNLEATTPPQVTIEQLREMMRTLLAERFKFQSHRETRQLEGYALVRLNPDRTGPGMQPSTLNCADPKAVRPAGSRFDCGMTFGPGSVTAGDITTAILADILIGAAGGVVVDRTGMSEKIDVELKWAPGLEPSELPSIFAAVQEQLGLKLQSERVPSDVLIIDHIERPTEN